MRRTLNCETLCQSFPYIYVYNVQVNLEMLSIKVMATCCSTGRTSAARLSKSYLKHIGRARRDDSPTYCVRSVGEEVLFDMAVRFDEVENVTRQMLYVTTS